MHSYLFELDSSQFPVVCSVCVKQQQIIVNIQNGKSQKNKY